MFKVMSKKVGTNIVKTVYAVKDDGKKVMFLFHTVDGWEWQNAEKWEPVS